MPLSLTLSAPTLRYAASGVLPLVVQAQVFGSSVTAENSLGDTESDPLHTVHFRWDFGDPNSTEQFQDPLTGQSRNSNSDQIGPHAAHTYRVAGLYKVTVTAWYLDVPTNTWISASSQSTYITVQTPESAGWEIGYFDPNAAATSQQLGTSSDPYVSLAQVQSFLGRRDNRALYIATGSVLQPKTNAVQTITFTGASGNFTVTAGGQTTANISISAAASVVQEKLRKLAFFGRYGCTVSGTGGTNGTYSITFTGQNAGVAQAAVTVSAPSGGGSAAVTTATAGGADVTTSVFTLTKQTGLRVGSYRPTDAPSGAPPILRLAATSSSKAVVSVVGNADADAPNAQQTITTNATGGNFILSYNGVSTSAIAWNASTATVQTRLTSDISALASNVTVTGSAGAWLVTFNTGLASTQVALLVATTDSGGTPLSTSSTTTVFIDVDWVNQGNPQRSYAADIVFDNIDFDGQLSTGSKGVELIRGGTAKGYCSNTYLLGSRIYNTLGVPLVVEAALNTAADNGPQGLGAVRTLFNATGSDGDSAALACTNYLSLVGCTFRGGDGDEDADNHVYFSEIGTSGTTQQYLLFRWNVFGEANKKNFGLYIPGGVRYVSLFHSRFELTRRGAFINRDGSGMNIPSDVIVEGCSFNNLGLSAYTGGRGLHLQIANNVSARNNVFYENGFSNGAADTTGDDIFIENAGVVSGLNDYPIRIYHNSFYRSYAKAGAPNLKIDDSRYLLIYNNAFSYQGGVGSGTDPNRSNIAFTNSSYVQPPRNEIQTLTITGTGVAGSFKLTVVNPNTAASQQTGLIAYNASAATVQSALTGLSNVGVGQLTVSGPNGGPWTVTFGGTFGFLNVDAITADTTSLTGTTPGMTIATPVGGSPGLVFIDGNVYYAPFLLYANINKPFVCDGSTKIPFSADTAVATWQNAGNASAQPTWDVHGVVRDPGFRNPATGDFRFNQTDPLVDFDTNTLLGVRFDYRLGVRGTYPDAGAYEFDGTSGATIYGYQPAPLVNLPTAGALASGSGGVSYIDALEPVQATSQQGVPGSPLNDIDNRPHRNLADRDNRLGASLDGLLQDVAIAFCSSPQAGSNFTDRHHSIASFMSVGHNPDGTLRLDGLDYSSLPYLRIDGVNSMLANLNMGSTGLNRIVNLGLGLTGTDAPNISQVLMADGRNNATGVLNMGANKITNLAAASNPSDAVRFDQMRSGLTASLFYAPPGVYTFTAPITGGMRFRVVAGGGANAGNAFGGAGGKGGEYVGVIQVIAGQTVTVTVGAGGAAVPIGTFTPGNAGGNSSVVVGANSITATGGGGGNVDGTTGTSGLYAPVGAVYAVYFQPGNSSNFYGQGAAARTGGVTGPGALPGTSGFVSVEW